jgi:hypothetical protein
MERELATEDDSDGLERNEVELGKHCQGFQENRGEEISIGVVLYVEKV